MIHSNLKQTPDDDAVRDAAYRVMAGELRQLIERYERLQAEKQDVADQQKEVIAELKGRGYDGPAFKRLIAKRKKDADKLSEEQAIDDLYWEVLT